MLINLFIYLRERKEWRETNIHGRAKHQSVACCMLPDQGSNPQLLVQETTLRPPRTLARASQIFYTDMYSLSPGDYFSFRGIGFWEVMTLAFPSLSVNLQDYFRSHRSMVRASS